MTEDGTELRNRFRGNLAIHPLIGMGPRNEDMPSGFWISNPDIELTGNSVAGSAFMGFWLAFTNVSTQHNTPHNNIFHSKPFLKKSNILYSPIFLSPLPKQSAPVPRVRPTPPRRRAGRGKWRCPLKDARKKVSSASTIPLSCVARCRATCCRKR